MRLDMTRRLRSVLGSAVFVFCFLLGQSAAEVAGSVDDDEIIFANGDRISGLVVTVDSAYIQLNSSALGPLKIAWINVGQVKSRGRSWRLHSQSAEPEMQYAAFRTAVLTKSNGLLVATVDSQKIEVPATSSVQLANQEHRTAGPVLAAPKPPLNPSTSFDVSLNSPVTVVDGSSSQETFGGTVRLFVNLPNNCKPAPWATTLLLSANHNRAWKVKSPAVVTDTFDGNLTMAHGLDSRGIGKAYLSADVWGNSSLGIGLQQSYGGGFERTLYSTRCPEANKPYQLSLTAKGGLHFVHQRLYAPGGEPLDLAGARTETVLTYQRLKNAKDTLLTLQVSMWAMPMINNQRAIQAGGDAEMIFPLNKSLSLSFTEEEDFVNNAPKAKRKNYLKSGATLTYSFPPPPQN